MRTGHPQPRLRRSQPALALTFDDGPSTETERILDCFEQHGAAGTFFVLGRHVGGREHVLRRMVELGSEVGNHTFTHPHLSQLDDAAAERELRLCSETISAAVAQPLRLMRPPYGDHGETTSSVARRLGLTTVLWSISTSDWDGRSADAIVEQVLSDARPGGVVVLHDGSAEGADRGATADAVERLVPALIDRGYRLVTVSELLRLDRRAGWEVVARRRGSPSWLVAAVGRRVSRAASGRS